MGGLLASTNVTVTWSFDDAPWSSTTVSSKVNSPDILFGIRGVIALVLTIVNGFGPLTFAQLYFMMVPSGSYEALAFRAVIVPAGRKTVKSLPAFATGAWFGTAGAGSTLTSTRSTPLIPLISVTVSVNSYFPTTRSLTSVVALVLSMIVNEPGPDTLFHW